MANNIGTIGATLPRTIGTTMTITDGSIITAVSGHADVGFIGFDNNGTMGVCTSFTRNADDSPVYVFRTCSLNTAIDVQDILEQEY